MGSKYLDKIWFEKRENGDLLNLPVSENFKHTQALLAQLWGKSISGPCECQ
jgi:hypothetical protein